MNVKNRTGKGPGGSKITYSINKVNLILNQETHSPFRTIAHSHVVVRNKKWTGRGAQGRSLRRCYILFTFRVPGPTRAGVGGVVEEVPPLRFLSPGGSSLPLEV